jgi:hypothetical protein
MGYVRTRILKRIAMHTNSTAVCRPIIFLPLLDRFIDTLSSRFNPPRIVQYMPLWVRHLEDLRAPDPRSPSLRCLASACARHPLILSIQANQHPECASISYDSLSNIYCILVAFHIPVILSSHHSYQQ